MRLREAFNKDTEQFIFLLVFGLTDIDRGFERLGLATQIEPPAEFNEFQYKLLQSYKVREYYE